MTDKGKPVSSLLVMDGVAQPPSVSHESVNKFKKARRKKPDPDEIARGIFSGDISVLGRAITLVESSLHEHQALAQQVIEECLPRSGNSVRVGITGVPGVGKSTFIESLGNLVTARGRKLAVLAIDPSSGRSKGSILGDKTRMERLSANPSAFIRPSPAAGSLGGVARKTRESIILCEAAGFDTLFIETVGVGQSEVAVHSMVDFFLLLILPGSGDELQGIKRGIMEMADGIAITKADGNNLLKARQAVAEYSSALHLFPPSPSGWVPRVMSCSAKSGEGLPEIWQSVLDYSLFATRNGYFARRRKEQARFCMLETIQQTLERSFHEKKHMAEKMALMEKRLFDNEISPFQAAQQLLQSYFGRTRH